MKTRVIIENGLTKIELTPENEFEKTIIEGFDRYGIQVNSDVVFETENLYGSKSKHKLCINLTTQKVR